MRVCAICGKGSIVAGKRKLLRGHYNLTKKERKYPNLQWVRLPLPVADLPSGTRVKICTQCLKNLFRGKAPSVTYRDSRPAHARQNA